jgi:hypothetical protein
MLEAEKPFTLSEDLMKADLPDYVNSWKVPSTDGAAPPPTAAAAPTAPAPTVVAP